MEEKHLKKSNATFFPYFCRASKKDWKLIYFYAFHFSAKKNLHQKMMVWTRILSQSIFVAFSVVVLAVINYHSIRALLQLFSDFFSLIVSSLMCKKNHWNFIAFRLQYESKWRLHKSPTRGILQFFFEEISNQSRNFNVQIFMSESSKQNLKFHEVCAK